MNLLDSVGLNMAILVLGRSGFKPTQVIDPLPALQSHLAPLDGWRGVAILMVLFAHGSPLAETLRVDLGSSGVAFFFILSGFLITTRLFTFYYRGGSVAFKEFYLQRAFRLFPPLLAYLSVVFIIGNFVAGVKVPFSEITASLFFFRNYLAVPQVENLSGWFTGQFWSLAVEEHYYLFWPLIVHLAGKKRSLPIALTGAFACVIWRNWLGVGSAIADVPYYLRSDMRVDGLLLGSALGVVFANPAWFARIQRVLSPRDSLAALLLLAAVWWHAGYWYLGITEELAVCALLMVTAAFPSQGLGRLLSWEPLCRVGKLSYSLYIWQELFLLTQRGGEPLGWLNRPPLNYAMVFAAALASYYLIERPAKRLANSVVSATRRSTQTGDLQLNGTCVET
jgi:peptidoglycan/LPS O-acetylase OafA/YrhL